MNDIWFWFSRSSARREDFAAVASDIKETYSRFIQRFVNTRWIEIGPVIERITEKWNLIKEYFLVYLPTIDKKIEKNDAYKRIKNFIHDKSTLPKLNFILFLYRTIFKKLLVWLQQEQPLVHLLYSELCTLLRNLFLAFVKEEIVKDKEGIQLLSLSFELQNNQKTNSNIDVGEITRTYIKELSSNEKVIFFQDVRQIYSSIAVSNLFRNIHIKILCCFRKI